MKQGLWYFLKSLAHEKTKAFYAGGISGATISGIYFIFGVHIALNWLVVAGIKLVGIGIGGLISGFLTALGADLYQQHLKHKIVKEKKDDKQRGIKKSA